MLPDWIKGLLEREAARIVAYSSAAATAATLFIAGQLGLEFSSEFVVAVGLAAAAIATEIIRQLVFSAKTTKALVAEAASSGSAALGDPPSGEQPQG